jgi:hypothetical protein
MKSFRSVCAVLVLASTMAACSVYMEATRPTPVDLGEFQLGMSRDAVMEKLGAPDSSAVESDETNCDFYRLYTRGYGAGGKIPIAVAEGAADFFTLGLAEVVLTPTEGVTKNEKHPISFCYRGQQLVRVTGEGQPNVAPVTALKPGETPPITAASSLASSAEAGTTPSANLTPSPTGAPVASTTPTPGPSPSVAPASSPTPQPNPSIGGPQR